MGTQTKQQPRPAPPPQGTPARVSTPPKSGSGTDGGFVSPNDAPAATPEPTPAPPPPVAEVAKAKRPRSAISLEKKLAIALGQLVAFVKGKGLVDPIIEAAEILAGDISAKVIGPIDARLAIIKVRVKELDLEDAAQAEEMGKLSQEVKRLKTKRQSVTG